MAEGRPARELAAGVTIRRVRPDDGPRIRELRLEALRDPMAPVAFLESIETAASRPDEEWSEVAARRSTGDESAQFLAERDGVLIGSLGVIVRRAGEPDYFERIPDVDLPTVIGVYVSPSGRGLGVIDALLAAATAFARSRGDRQLTLDVHETNLPAIGAYERAGFEHRTTYQGASGRELGMVRRLAPKD
jgi:ribosomal protein S18 acetylase RimI-like enzyme